MRRAASLALLVAAALAAPGCGTARPSALYEKPGGTVAEQQRDSAECLGASAAAEQPPLLSVQSTLPVPLDRDAYEACMRARGYRIVRAP